jgi:hypothetical protein
MKKQSGINMVLLVALTVYVTLGIIGITATGTDADMLASAIQLSTPVM